MAESPTKATGSAEVPRIEKDQDESNYVITETSSSWTPEEEAALVRKIDFAVIPVLWIGFFALQLDRGNIGNTLTDNFLEDVNITQNQFNIGGSLMSLGIVLFEIPSNIVLMRLGPKIWIGGQIVAWGMVATFQAFQYGLGAFLSTRFLLGLCEAGFIPASLYTLSLWYKSDEMSKRFAIFFTGNILSQAVGGLMAFGILHMRGVANMAGWQWLFILEGVFTIVIGFIFILMFPGSPTNPVSICRVSWFNEREAMILRDRILLDDASKVGEKHKVTARDVLNTVSDWRIWPHLLIPLAANTTGHGYATYGPSIIVSFGYGNLEANALASVGQWISGLIMCLAGLVADKTGRRGLVTLGCLCIDFVFVLSYKLLPVTAPRGTRYGVFTLGAATMLWYHPINGSWLSVNAKSPAERSMRMAMFIMAANIAGIMGSQIFRSEDKPNYPDGFTAIVCLVAFATTCAAVGVVGYKLGNRKLLKRGVGVDGDVQQVQPDQGQAHPRSSTSDEEEQASAVSTGVKLYNY